MAEEGESKQPIIVIKRIKKSAHAHHGGSWKVAYADFVTAMMAFFLLLWLINAVSSQNLKAIAEYFTPTIGLKGEKGIGFKGGLSPEESGTERSSYSSPSLMQDVTSGQDVSESAEDIVLNDNKVDEKNFFNLEKEIAASLSNNEEIKPFKDRVVLDRTPEGLRIQLLENQDKPLFKPGSYELQPYTKVILKFIGNFVKYLPNYLSLEGHTTPFQTSGPNIIDNWTLSAARADAARKFLVDNSVPKEQIYRIVGKADQEPLKPEDPANLSNIRISMIILKSAIVPYQKSSLPKDFLQPPSPISASN